MHQEFLRAYESNHRLWKVAIPDLADKGPWDFQPSSLNSKFTVAWLSLSMNHDISVFLTYLVSKNCGKKCLGESQSRWNFLHSITVLFVTGDQPTNPLSIAFAVVVVVGNIRLLSVVHASYQQSLFIDHHDRLDELVIAQQFVECRPTI